MAILPTIGMKSPKMRAAVLAMYVLLIAGSITMLYPFLIMLSGSVKGNADVQEMDAVPRVLYSEATRFARFEEERYPFLTTLSAAYSREMLRFEDAELPAEGKNELGPYQQFLSREGKSFPEHFYLVQEMWVVQKILPRNFRRFRSELRTECPTVEAFNRRYGTVLTSWNDFQGFLDIPLTKEFCYEKTPLIDRYLRFKRSRPLEERAVLNIDGHFRVVQRSFPLVKSGEARSVGVLRERLPAGVEGLLWTEFVKHHLNCMFIRLDEAGARLFRDFITRKHPGGVAEFNRINGTAYPSLDAVGTGLNDLRNSAVFVLYTSFVTNVCPAEHLIVDTPSTRYRRYLGSDEAIAPFVAADYAAFKQTRNSFLLEIATRNYLNVLQFIVVYGRAIFNTVAFVALSILAALLVNPLAAYALSRFNLKSTYTILMFFMATMAFPAAVTMIPNFLLLKHLHLLNSFWALVLPGIANGYFIFILKGFFDSIPKEVHESAMIDGASEWTMFWRFTMALSKPILALIALGAFTGAYSAFMFALIICPDERMWTLMVWLYQLQQGAHQSVIYAALVLAAIPTMLVFVLAQNTIMRGIVIPVEK